VVDEPVAVRATSAEPVAFPLGWRIADAYLVLVGALLLELVAVGLVAHRELAGPYELARAVACLLPLAAIIAAPFAVLGALIVELGCKADRGGARAALAGLVAAFAGAVAFGVSGGRHFNPTTRVVFVAALTFAGAALVAIAAPKLARAQSAPRRRSHALLAMAVLAAFALLELVNARVLPRLYPAFHAGLGALALLAAAWLILAWDEGRQRSLRGALARVAAALVLFASSAALTPYASRSLAFSDNLRLIVHSRAPLLKHAIELGALVAPPAPLPLDDNELPERATTKRTVDFTGRDLVLITIDALRADHVGAYGYGRPTTPYIDKLAESGVVFDAAYTTTPHTSYALTSLMTGKYMRPLVLQGLGADSETWATHLRRYGYRTAAFYPPAVFFIDTERFTAFRERGLDFEYRRVEFATADDRAREVETYLGSVTEEQRLFLWVHLFEPHEPYESHDGEPSFGERDLDRYDAEVRAADRGIGKIVELVRAKRPGAVVMVTADHGEEFGEHGGRYHGTTVFEEQVRVPLIVSAPERLGPRRVKAPVQLVDLLPTVLSALAIPKPARVRGADLGPWLTGGEPVEPEGFAFAETQEQALLARGFYRLICARKIGACALYDLGRDPHEQVDIAADEPATVARLRADLRAIEASHGRYERRGLHAEGKGWPEALRRAIAGDGDAVADVAPLLDDADVVLRRKAAEVLFELGRVEAAAALRLALVRDEDVEVRRWSAVALTRLGEGAPLTHELLDAREIAWRRLAALALAESGDRRGEDVLIAWWREAFPAKTKDPRKAKEPVAIPFERAREIVRALATLRSKGAVVPLIDALDDVRLRPYLAAALAAIGQKAARPALAARLTTERSQSARVAIMDALVRLEAGPELRAPLVFLLGIPDPLPNGLGYALKADILDLVGGPRKKDLARLRLFANSGVAMSVVVPKGGRGGGARVLCRARSLDRQPGELRFGPAAPGTRRARSRDGLVPSVAPELDGRRALTLAVPGVAQPVEVFATLPEDLGINSGHFAEFVVYSTQNVELEACAVVPLSDELPPPPPKPWKVEADAGSQP
jgi:arylsulfatase A-like enzyme